MKDRITISGLPGSGTTTVATILKKKLNLPYIYAGEIFRKMAEKYGMELLAFEKYCEEHPEVDKELDEKQEEILRKGKVILEGRLAGWIAYKNRIPAFKIWLDCEKGERVKRIIKREGGSFEVKRKEMEEREESETKRYKNFYGIDLNDVSIYDVVVDTTHIPPKKVVEKILEKYGNIQTS
ncbi:MAG: cytidylate kinase [Thermoplasmata archaeon]|nr:MAG: cytidylate kinase [Thermoplasmata archaeon]